MLRFAQHDSPFFHSFRGLDVPQRTLGVQQKLWETFNPKGGEGLGSQG
jgi:hypothetical protein